MNFTSIKRKKALTRIKFQNKSRIKCGSECCRKISQLVQLVTQVVRHLARKWVKEILKLFRNAVTKVAEDAGGSALEDLMPGSSEAVSMQEKRRDLRHVAQHWRNGLEVVVGQVEGRQSLQRSKPTVRRVELLNLVVAREDDFQMDQIVDAFRECCEAVVRDVDFAHRNHQAELVGQRLQLVAAQVEIFDVIELRHERLNFGQHVRVHVELGNDRTEVHQALRKLLQLVLAEVHDGNVGGFRVHEKLLGNLDEVLAAQRETPRLPQLVNVRERLLRNRRSLHNLNFISNPIAVPQSFENPLRSACDDIATNRPDWISFDLQTHQVRQRTQRRRQAVDGVVGQIEAHQTLQQGDLVRQLFDPVVAQIEHLQARKFLAEPFRNFFDEVVGDVELLEVLASLKVGQLVNVVMLRVDELNFAQVAHELRQELHVVVHQVELLEI